MSVGQSVVGIGNAGGQGGTPTAVGGTVTALDQQIVAGDQGGGNAEQLSGLIQTNAAIQSGQSGGPLVNTDGEVIGVLAAASARNGAYQGGNEGYAVPIDTAIEIVNQIQSGESTDSVHVGATAFLGVSLTDAGYGYGDGYGQGGYGNGSGDYGYGDPYGYGDSNGQSGTTDGATVVDVLSGSPADEAGLEAGDVILSVDGTSIDSASELSDTIATYQPGDTVKVIWTDQSGNQDSATVTLTEEPGEVSHPSRRSWDRRGKATPTLVHSPLDQSKAGPLPQLAAGGPLLCLAHPSAVRAAGPT